MDDYSKVSAIVLSGGLSSRMGQDKCDLEFDGETLLNIQIDKLKSIFNIEFCCECVKNGVNSNEL